VPSLPKSERPTAEPESRWGGPATILGLILVGAAALRLVGVRYGLPDGGLLNPDEELVVPRAWVMTHGGGIDPNPFFDWPSLLLYVQAPFQAWQDAPSYFTARVVGVAIGLAGVASAWWLGERSYGVLAGGVAAVATAVAGVHVAYSRMAVTDVLLTTLVTVALGLLVTRRYELAGLVIGAATAAKWPGALALVPLAVAAWGQWRRLAYAAGLALAGFVVASPFAVVHLGEAASDWWRGLSRAWDGSLGAADDSFSAVAFTSDLWEALGPALVVALIGLAVAVARRDRADRVLASFVAVYFLSLLPLDSHFDRYVLPIVPVLGVLAGRFRSFAPVTLLLLVVPFAWTVRDTRELTRTEPRAAFGALVEREVAGAAAPGPWVSVHRLPSRR
jgi:4-amino-4-deoxy-L-arabinose transferase-like glycosyltransferase